MEHPQDCRAGGGRRGLLEEAQDSSPSRQLKEMSVLRPGLNRAIKNQLPPWVSLFWTNHSLLAELPLLSKRPAWANQPCSCTFLENCKHNADNLDGFGGGSWWLAEILFPNSQRAPQQSKSVKQMLSDVHHFLLCKCKYVRAGWERLGISRANGNSLEGEQGLILSSLKTGLYSPGFRPDTRRVPRGPAALAQLEILLEMWFFFY
jgi:hypothetical protein